MKCDQCDKDATIHLTQVIEGEVKKVHLCEACAIEQGLDVQHTLSITDMLLGSQEALAVAGAEDEPSTSCPRCHMTRADFKKTGRLGCPHCYEHFKEGLGQLLHAVQRSDQHIGKIPTRESVRVKRTAEIAALKQALDSAIADEAYEEAARLRDQIRECREVIETHSGGEQA